MKLYLSAELGSLKQPLARGTRRFAEQLETEGHETTYKWWENAWLPVKPEAHWELSADKIAAIREADALVLIPPDSGGVDCFLEAGFAMGMNKHVHLVRCATISRHSSMEGVSYHGRESSFFHNEELVTERRLGHAFLDFITPSA